MREPSVKQYKRDGLPFLGFLDYHFLAPLYDFQWDDLLIEYKNGIDLPPGTGDAQLTLAQSCPISGAIIITTPQEVALEDVYRAIRMFGHVNVPVVGIVENMSTFIAPDTGKRYDIFRQPGVHVVTPEKHLTFMRALLSAKENQVFDGKTRQCIWRALYVDAVPRGVRWNLLPVRWRGDLHS